jgi:hypothetical protein
MLKSNYIWGYAKKKKVECHWSSERNTKYSVLEMSYRLYPLSEQQHRGECKFTGVHLPYVTTIKSR